MLHKPPHSDRFCWTADTPGEQKGRLSTTGAVEESVDTTVGFRCIAVSPDGNHLAAGDSSGNLRIFDLNNLLLHCFQVRTAILFFDTFFVEFGFLIKLHVFRIHDLRN